MCKIQFSNSIAGCHQILFYSIAIDRIHISFWGEVKWYGFIGLKCLCHRIPLQSPLIFLLWQLLTFSLCMQKLLVRARQKNLPFYLLSLCMFTPFHLLFYMKMLITSMLYLYFLSIDDRTGESCEGYGGTYPLTTNFVYIDTISPFVLHDDNDHFPDISLFSFHRRQNWRILLRLLRNLPFYPLILYVCWHNFIICFTWRCWSLFCYLSIFFP